MITQNKPTYLEIVRGIPRRIVKSSPKKGGPRLCMDMICHISTFLDNRWFNVLINICKPITIYLMSRSYVWNNHVAYLHDYDKIYSKCIVNSVTKDFLLNRLNKFLIKKLDIIIEKVSDISFRKFTNLCELTVDIYIDAKIHVSKNLKKIGVYSYHKNTASVYGFSENISIESNCEIYKSKYIIRMYREEIDDEEIYYPPYDMITEIRAGSFNNGYIDRENDSDERDNGDDEIDDEGQVMRLLPGFIYKKL